VKGIFGGCDALAVEAAGRGMFVAPHVLTHVGAQHFMKTLLVPLSRYGRKYLYTLGHFGYAWGSIRHVRPLSTTYKRALTTARISSSRGAHPVWG
jgi:hypothetical protein